MSNFSTKPVYRAPLASAVRQVRPSLIPDHGIPKPAITEPIEGPNIHRDAIERFVKNNSISDSRPEKNPKGAYTLASGRSLPFEKIRLLFGSSYDWQRSQLENVWHNLTAGERRDLLAYSFHINSLTTRSFARLPEKYSLESAFFLYQLFGRGAPIEMALGVTPNDRGGYDFSFVAGDRNSVHSDDSVIAHTHPSRESERIVHSIMPSVDDIERNLDDLEDLRTQFFKDGLYSHFILGPLGGSVTAFSKEEPGAIAISWATRPDAPDDPEIAEMMKYQYKSRFGSGMEFYFKRISFNRYLEILAEYLLHLNS